MSMNYAIRKQKGKLKQVPFYMKRKAEAVIVGGGCMGCSVAWHLAQRGITDVVLLEREPQLATGSTGKNAGGVRHQFSHPANIELSKESIGMIARFEDIVGVPTIDSKFFISAIDSIDSSMFAEFENW